ncbi:hypothetical protein C1645_835773, partial [Glomus cerebriforme]
VSDQNSDSQISPISSKGSTTEIPSKRIRVDHIFTTQSHRSLKCWSQGRFVLRDKPINNQRSDILKDRLIENQRSIITQLTSDFNLSTSSPVSKQTVENQRTSDTMASTISHKTNSDLCKTTDNNTSSHITPIPESLHSYLEKITYKNMMASAIHNLAIANISYKNNRELSPYKMHKIMNEFDINSVGKTYGSVNDYGEKVIKVFNEGGMDKILKSFEEGITSYINTQPKENRPYMNFIKGN